jgi:hypothetical protein
VETRINDLYRSTRLHRGNHGELTRYDYFINSLHLLTAFPLLWFLFTTAFLLIITMANSQSSLANMKTLVTMIEARVANLTHARWVYQAGLALLAHYGADDKAKAAEGVAAIAEIDVLLAQFQEVLTDLFSRINKKKDDDDDDDFNGTTGEGIGGGGSGGLAAAA